MKCMFCGVETEYVVEFEHPVTGEVYDERPVCLEHEPLLLQAALEEGAQIKATKQ